MVGLYVRTYHRWDIINGLHEEIPFDHHQAIEASVLLMDSGIPEIAAHRLVSKWNSNIQWSGQRFVYWI